MTAVAYFIAARLGLLLALEHESVSAVWPPTGVAIAALLLLGYRAWPGILLGAFIANVWTTNAHPIATAAAIASGNTLEALAAAWLTTRLAGGTQVFDRLWNIARYVFIAAPGAVAISATVGVSALIISDNASIDIAPKLWLTWWLGDLVGALVVAPLILIWLQRRYAMEFLSRKWEAASLLVISAAILTLLFSGLIPGVFDQQTLGFLVIPPMAWAAFRFGSRGAIAVATLISAAAIEGTVNGHGPFLRTDLNTALLIVQAFVGIVTVTSLGIAAVVQQLHQAELSQRQSHHRLEMALMAGNMGAWKWHIASGAITWSPALEAIHGLAPGGFGGTFNDLQRDMHPEDREQIAATIRKAMESHANEPYHVRYRIIRPHGELAWLEATGQMTRDAGGKPVEMMGVCSDITARVLAQRMLQAEHTVTRVLTAAPSLQDAAQEILRAFGESVDGSVAELWIPAGHQPHLECAAIWTRPGLRSADEFLRMSREIRFPKGKGLPGRVWAGTSAATIIELTDDKNFPRRDVARLAGLRSGLAFPIAADGEFLGVIEFFADHRIVADAPLIQMMTAIGQDIAQFMQRKRAEEARQRSQELYQAILESALDCIISIDERGNVIEWNPAAETTFGFTRDAVLGRPLSTLIVPARLRESHQQGLHRFLTTGVASVIGRRVEMPALRADGTELQVELALTTMQTQSGTIFTAHVRDITQRQLAQQALRDSEASLRARAEELQAIMDAVPAVVWVAHDPQCKVITGNKAAQEFLRLPPGANASKSAAEGERPTTFRVFRDGMEVPADQLPVQLAAAEGRPIMGQSYELRYDDGSVAHEYGNAVPLFDEAGKVRGAIATFIDITSLKRAESELANLKDELAGDLADMTRLHELSMRLLNTDQQDLNALLQQVLEACAALLGTTMGNIQIVDERDQALKIVAHMGFTGDFLDYFGVVERGHSVCGLALERRERVIVEDVFADPVHAELGPVFKRFGFIAVQSTPLFSSDGRLFGMLSNHFAQPHRPSDQELRLLDLYAQQAARVLERHRAEQALRSQYERLQALYTLSHAVGSAEALDDIYRQSIESLLRALRADRASVLLFDSEGVMRFKAWHGLSEGYRNAVEGHSPWKKQQIDAQPITMEDVAAREDLGPLREVVLGEGIQALAFIPLLSGGRLLGKFMVYFNQPHRFSDEELQLARTIAGHVAFALERLSAQRQLRESDQISRRRLAELAAVYSDVPVGLCFVNSEHRFVKVNPQFTEFSGLTPEHMIGRRADEVFAGDSEVVDIIRRVIASGEAVLNRELSLTAAGGTDSQRDWLQSFCPVTDAAGEMLGVNCVVVDITERKRIEREIQHHRERLEELIARRTADLEVTHQRLRASERLAAMGTLSAGLGHDMGNLLLPMKARLDVLQSLDLPREVRDHLHGIELCAKYLQDLVRGLRLFSQDPAEASADAATNLREWQLQTYPFYHSVLPRSIKLECDIPEDVPPVAIAPHALTQAVLNLVNNARDAIGAQRAGQVLLRARLETRPGAQDGRAFVRLSIIDDGPGMSAEVKARALEPFFTTKTRSLSTGLGLSMVHGLARSAGGHVEIHSPPQHETIAPAVAAHNDVSRHSKPPCPGTQIALVLPAAEAVAEIADQSYERPRAAISVADPRACAVLASMLDSMGFHVMEANGKPEGGAVWFTEPSEQRLAAAQAFLQGNSGRAVIVIGDAPPEWHALPIKVIDRACKPSAIRAALSDLVEELAGGTDRHPN